MSLQLCGESLTFVSPFEGFSHGPIVVFHKGQDFGFELLQGGEVTSFK